VHAVAVFSLRGFFSILFLRVIFQTNCFVSKQKKSSIGLLMLLFFLVKIVCGSWCAE